ncbi:MAG: CHAT domain-containing protein, partial [Leptospiraceae bacterium]|nr:CHAT domain-containing protein [Leptospiraceae bacterium]
MRLSNIIVDRSLSELIFNLVDEQPEKHLHLHARMDPDLIQELLQAWHQIGLAAYQQVGDSHWSAVMAQRIKDIGEHLYRQLLPTEMQPLLAQRFDQAIFWHVDTSLADIPWHILHDGNSFLMDRLAIGVHVGAQSVARAQDHLEKVRMLIVADPASNLPWARQEGEELYDRLLSHVSSERLVVQYLAGQRASKLRLLDEIR